MCALQRHSRQRDSLTRRNVQGWQVWLLCWEVVPRPSIAAYLRLVSAQRQACKQWPGLSSAGPTTLGHEAAPHRCRGSLSLCCRVEGGVQRPRNKTNARILRDEFSLVCDCWNAKEKPDKSGNIHIFQISNCVPMCMPKNSRKNELDPLPNYLGAVS
jgi:hypothetical protein